jgi:hypothetical protein
MFVPIAFAAYYLICNINVAIGLLSTPIKRRSIYNKARFALSFGGLVAAALLLSVLVLLLIMRNVTISRQGLFALLSVWLPYLAASTMDLAALRLVKDLDRIGNQTTSHIISYQNFDSNQLDQSVSMAEATDGARGVNGANRAGGFGSAKYHNFKMVWRAILGLIVVGALATGLFGLAYCVGNPAVKEQAIQQHLKDKYGDINYTVESYEGLSFSQGYYQLTGELPGGVYGVDTFTATYYPAADGKPAHYLDSYYGLAKREQFEAMVKPIADRYFKESRIYTTYDEFPDDVVLGDAIQSVIAAGKFADNEVDVYIPISTFEKRGKFDDKSFNKVSDAFAKAWTKQCNRSEVGVFAVDPEVYQQLANRDYIYTIENSPNGYDQLIHSYSSPISYTDRQFDPSKA